MQFVPGELSHKILREARAQQEEVDAEEAGHGTAGRRSVSASCPPVPCSPKCTGAQCTATFAMSTRANVEESVGEPIEHR